METTWSGKADTKTMLYELSDRYEFILQRLGSDVATVYVPTSTLASLRQSMGDWFSKFSRGYEPPRDEALALYAELKTQGQVLTTSLRSFGANQSHLVDSMAKLKDVSQALVSTMRSRGNDEFANLLFSAEQSVKERLRGRNVEDLASIAALIEEIRSPGYQMTAADRTELEAFANAAENAGEWRVGMVQNFAAMRLESFTGSRNQLQETLAATYVQGLVRD